MNKPVKVILSNLYGKFGSKKVDKNKSSNKIIGVTLGWSGKPQLCFEGGYVLFGNADKILYPEYFKNGDFPTDPVTNEKLPIAVYNK